VKVIKGYKDRTPKNNKTPTPNRENRDGNRTLLVNFFNVDLLHATRGHRPVRKSRARPIGIIAALKNGAPTVIFTPLTASEIMGKSVPQNTVKAIPTKSKLL
jgi:hypothetical protein